jgi:TolA-binding protein
MRAYEAGDYGRADALFGAFAREFPNDSRTEDALFLKAYARARRGDREGASRAASEYLKRYPQGFRSPEAKRLVLP